MTKRYNLAHVGLRPGDVRAIRAKGVLDGASPKGGKGPLGCAGGSCDGTTCYGGTCGGSTCHGGTCQESCVNTCGLSCDSTCNGVSCIDTCAVSCSSTCQSPSCESTCSLSNTNRPNQPGELASNPADRIAIVAMVGLPAGRARWGK